MPTPLTLKPVKSKKAKAKPQVRSFTQRAARDTNSTKLKKLGLLYEEWNRVAAIVSDKVWALFQAAGDLPRELRSSGDPSAPLYVFPPTSLVSSMLVASTAKAVANPLQGAEKLYVSSRQGRYSSMGF